MVCSTVSASPVRPVPALILSSSLCRTSLLSSTCCVQTPTLSITLTADSNRYGPSLLHLQRPPSVSSDGDGESDLEQCSTIDRSAFTRTFTVAALRVSAADCSNLERRLRGHLLNWPRVRNVARVPGDDLEPDIRSLLRDEEGDGGQRLNSLASRAGGESDAERKVLSPVLYRDKLAKEFNYRGFLKFRSLAKMSRPKKKKRRTKEQLVHTLLANGVGKKDYSVIEILREVDKEEDLSGLLGDEFRPGRWRGPTRLLLLDERYADKGMEELPEAVKAVMAGGTLYSEYPVIELVQCQLKLFYDYWPVNEILESILPAGMIVPTGFETVGHIAHLNLRDEHLVYKKLIAQVVLDKNRPKIQTVVNKVDTIQNDYRTMQLEVLAGNHSLVTAVIENGLRFQVDLAKVFWNSRLATERQRLVSCFASSDVVCDVFSGVGPITISAAKKVKYVYANDINPHAVEYLERNVILNKLDRKVKVFNMDGRRFIESLFSVRRLYPITQVVMHLPNDSIEFLVAFQGIYKTRERGEECSLPRIHVYGFSKADNPEFDIHERINMVLCKTVVDIETHRVRLVAPGKWMLCASFLLPENVAFT
ncbi:tRNA (guanine(37)-N1)-methyltransferase 1 [Apostasia shenzhenica]|uniref:tRNA (guanine(37)-N1)-methyltransferase n=1 Tax=Apostasia shenzhenica TaxID=1088818 RepID=A0A2I0AAR3_9ASPA|nr:tRNA (guanine(37)-N1)-methyltransferase 1 [Apostasia shenzhenica]